MAIAQAPDRKTHGENWNEDRGEKFQRGTRAQEPSPEAVPADVAGQFGQSIRE